MSADGGIVPFPERGMVWPDKNVNGTAKASYPNTLLAMRHLGARFARDLFRGRDTIDWHFLPGGAGPREVSDGVFVALRDAIIGKYNFDPKAQNVVDAVASLCVESQFDPCVDYFRSLKWDGRERLSKWLVTYLGAVDDDLNRNYGRIMLTAAVRRVFWPGMKFDSILVLEGPQGAGKSSALAALVPHEDFFTDQDMLHLDTQAQQEALAGKLIVELGELAGLKRTDSERVKAFASRTHDRARAAYGRVASAQARRCIFFGTTNSEDYLTDHTGNRRFWPVRCGAIDLHALRTDRDQIWAEAVVGADDESESLVLPERLWKAAEKAQDARLEDDPWAEKLARIAGKPHTFGEYVTTGDAFDLLGIETNKRHAGMCRRIAISMRKLGWKGPIDVRSGSVVVKGYIRSGSKALTATEKEELF